MLLAMATKRRTRHEDNDSVQDTELVDLTLIDVSAQIALPIFLILAYTAGNTNTQAPLQPILTVTIIRGSRCNHCCCHNRCSSSALHCQSDRATHSKTYGRSVAIV